MKKLILPIALVAMMAVPGSALAVNADLEQQGDLFQASPAQASSTTVNPAVVGDALGEVRYREDADKTRREFRLRAEEFDVYNNAGQPHEVEDTDQLAICIRGPKDTTTMDGACGPNGQQAVRPVASNTFAPFFTEAGRLEVRGRSEDGQPDPAIVVPDLDAGDHLVEVINGLNGLISAAGVLSDV